MALKGRACDRCGSWIPRGEGYEFFSSSQTTLGIYGGMFACESCCGELMSESAFRRLVMPSLEPDEVEGISGRPDQRHIIVEADGDAGVIERCKALGLTPAEGRKKAREFARKFWSEQGKPGSEFIFYSSEGERYWTSGRS